MPYLTHHGPANATVAFVGLTAKVELAEPLMRNDRLGKSHRWHARVRLQREQISEGAENKPIHGESGCKGGEFGREGVHVCLLKQVVVILRWGNLERSLEGPHAIFGE